MARHKFQPTSTKVKNVTEEFDLTDQLQREKYFQTKAGKEITKIKNYLDSGGTFVAYLMGKKGSGKGTRAKMFADLVGNDKVAHIGIGDIVRDVHKALETPSGKKELIEFLQNNYRGYITIEEGIEAILGRSQDKVSVPDQLVLALIKREVDKNKGKALFIDGFPRTLDQVSYSLFFRELINYNDSPDFFVLVDVPETVIDQRIKSRVVCPLCQSPRGLQLMPTKYVGYDENSKEFFLKCDNPTCDKARMIGKEGDSLGIESIRTRLEGDESLMNKTFSLYGVPKVLLRNSIPVNEAKDLVDDYEITPEFYYENQTDGVVTKTRPWVIKDDDEVDSFSLLPEPNVLAMIWQIAELLP